MKYSWKGHTDRNRHKNRIKWSGQARLVYVFDINCNIPTTMRRWVRGDNGQRKVKLPNLLANGTDDYASCQPCKHLSSAECLCCLVFHWSQSYEYTLIMHLVFERCNVTLIIIINPLTAGVVGAPQMILQPVFSIFPCSPLPSGTCRTPGLSIPWCCHPTSSFVRLVFFPLSLCLARLFWSDLMNGRHVRTTTVCVSLRWSGIVRMVQLPAGS